MGFTIDMITGNISNITNGADVVESENVVSTSIVDTESMTHEQLLPVSETLLVPDVDTYIPGSLIDNDIDVFIEDMSR